MIYCAWNSIDLQQLYKSTQIYLNNTQTGSSCVIHVWTLLYI